MCMPRLESVMTHSGERSATLKSVTTSYLSASTETFRAVTPRTWASPSIYMAIAPVTSVTLLTRIA